MTLFTPNPSNVVPFWIVMEALLRTVYQKYAPVMTPFPPTPWLLGGKWASNSDNFVDMYISTAFWTLILYLWLNSIQCCSTKCTKGLTQLLIYFMCKSTSITSIFNTQWNSFSCAFYYSMKAQFLTSSTHGSLLLIPLPGKKMDAYCFHFIFFLVF